MTFNTTIFGESAPDTAGVLIQLGNQVKIYNELGHRAVSYDSLGNLQFQGPNGVYTPARFDTMKIYVSGADDTEPLLTAVVPGSGALDSSDFGGLVTSDPSLNVNVHGLPVNFGPGRGNWARYTTEGPAPALECSLTEDLSNNITAESPVVLSSTGVSGDDASFAFRNTGGDPLQDGQYTLVLRVLHSVQS